MASVSTVERVVVIYTGWARFNLFLGYHHVMMMVLTVSIVLSSILLAGCSSSNMNNVYLLSLSYASTPSHQDAVQVNPSISTTFANLTTPAPALEVRVGYMGFCMPDSTGDWICSRHAKSLAKTINNTHTSSSGDPLNLLWIANNFQSQIVFDGLIFSTVPLVFISILLLSTFPRWHEEEDAEGSEREVKPFPSRPVSYIVFALLILASLLIFVSVFWQHIASSAAVTMGQSLSYGTVKGKVGAVAMVLGWGSVFLDILAGVAMYVMILSIKVLSET
ncbi:uncharacterized protein K444DRAFT_601714 [Hyaloscypha bicolor E]|uniref:Membrane fusion mating protein FIG1 n=1 Tax=Hyaloscypha bicolor E TaxID=1095630 RepID=A0A2J6SKV0_9HELO|nr:uncharacterized protein K444DRAFT_601714 [Hyaloscypha bicolor E]PMD51401.1 hypothetical protein K444DRAFT_601714 [Hyaloscypha bicolor E]